MFGKIITSVFKDGNNIKSTYFLEIIMKGLLESIQCHMINLLFRAKLLGFFDLKHVRLV